MLWRNGAKRKHSQEYNKVCSKLDEIAEKYLISDETGRRVIDFEKMHKDKEVLKLFKDLDEMERDGRDYEDSAVNIEERKYWMFVEKAFERKDKELLRIYINLKGKDKEEFVRSFLEKCDEFKLPYQFKFSLYENRRDEVIIISDLEKFSRYIDIVSDIVKDKPVGELPILVGKYKENIGIVSDHDERLGESFNKQRIYMIETAFKKYILDNLETILPLCNEEEKSVIKAKKERMDWLVKRCKSGIEKMEERIKDAIEKGDKEGIERCREIKSENVKRLENAEENLDMEWNGRIQSDWGEFLLPSIKEKILARLPEELDEIVKNYRLVCERAGISRNGIFMLSLEEELDKARVEYDGTELEKFRATLTKLVPTAEEQVRNSRRFQEKNSEIIIANNSNKEIGKD